MGSARPGELELLRERALRGERRVVAHLFAPNSW
jgi:hypothetical protein